MIWQRLKSVSIKQLFMLVKLFLPKPLYIPLTLKASTRAMSIASDEYGKKHNGNTKANAFRHALWTVLICQAVFSRKQSPEKSVKWAKKVTDFHEKLAPNKPLEREMDLHNNTIGCNLWKENKNLSEAEFITLLKEKSAAAKQVKTVDEVKDFKENLVYMTD